MGEVLRVAAYAAILLGLLGLTLWLARRRGLFTPTLVAAVLQLATILVVHAVSVTRGDDGYLFLDDRGYAIFGRRLADAWSNGVWVDPTSINYVGSTYVGYPMLVGAVFLLVGSSV